MQQKVASAFKAWLSGALLVAFAVGLRLAGLDKGLWLDEYAGSLAVVLQKNYSQVIELSKYDVHPPLYLLLLNAWSRLGSSEIHLRLLSVVLGSFTVVVIMRWMNRHDRLAGILAGLMAAVTPVFLRFSQEVRAYSLLVFSTSVAFYMASAVLEHPRRVTPYLGLAVAVTLAASTHLVGILLILPIFAFLALSPEREERVRYTLLGIFTLLPLSAFLYFYVVFLDIPGRTAGQWWMPPLSWGLVVSTVELLLGFTNEPWPWTALHETSRPESTLALLFHLFVLSLAVALFRCGDRRRVLPFAAAAALYWLQVLLLSFLGTPVYWYRTLLPGMVPLVGCLALGVATVPQRRIQHLLAGGIAATTLLHGSLWLAAASGIPIEDWRGAGRRLGEHWRKGDIVLIYPDYAGTTLLHYASGVPPEATAEIPLRAQAEISSLSIAKQPGWDNGAPGPPSMFIVIRSDLSVMEDVATFEKLLEKTRGPDARFARVYACVIIAHDVTVEKKLKLSRRRIISMLAKAFGPPLRTEDSGSLFWAVYEEPPDL